MVPTAADAASFFVLLLTIGLIASQSILAQSPRCYNVRSQVRPADCLYLLNRLPHTAMARDNRAWGRPGEETKLPKTILTADGCQLAIRKSHRWREPALSFRVMDYEAAWRLLYDRCAATRSKQGGLIAIGPAFGVDAIIWDPRRGWETNETAIAAVQDGVEVDELAAEQGFQSDAGAGVTAERRA